MIRASRASILVSRSADIIVVHRAEGSATSFAFTDYLSKVSAEWQQKVGKGPSVSWPVRHRVSGDKAR